MVKKTLLKTMILLCALMAGSGSVWAEDITYTLTISPSDFTTSSYANNNTEKTKNAVCTTDNTKTFAVKWTSYQVYQNSQVMQWQKSNGYIYNSTNLGTISSVVVNNSSGTFTTYYGTSSKPSSGAAGSGKGYFKTSVGSDEVGKTTSVVVSFKFTIPTVTFNNSNVINGQTLNLNDLFTSNSEGAVTYTITAGGSNGQIESDGHTLTGLNEGEVTVKASQAAKGIYADKEVTATIIVTSSTSPNVTVSESSLAFGEIEVGQTKQMTFTVTPANLTGNLTIASYDDALYTVSPTFIAQSTTTAQTITVTATPTALNDNMNGSITISGGGLASNKIVTLIATPYQVANVTLSASNGSIKEGDETKTSLTSRVGNTATLKAVPADGYLFDSWTAVGATPASSNTAETEFTFTATSVTLTANFVVDPRMFVTLNGTDMAAMTNAGTTYGSGSSNLKTIVKDGLTWTADAYQEVTNTKNKMLQLRTRTNSSGVSFIQLPVFSGNIQSITMSVTNANANSSTGGGAATTLSFQNGKTKDETVVASSGSDESNEKVIDLSNLTNNYQTGYITVTGSNAVRVWNITVAFIPTDKNVSVTSAKYATFSDHVARDFSASGISVYKANASGSSVTLSEISDGIVPANTGVILYSDVVKTDEAIPVATAAGTGDYSDNEMVATVSRTLVKKTEDNTNFNYIMQLDGGSIVFNMATTGGAYMPAGKAYLSTTVNAASRLNVVVADETQGVKTVDNSQMTIDNSVYNLRGQRVSQPGKGLYIVNGKKVLVK